MIRRFQGREGAIELKRAILNQRLVQNDTAIAKAIISRCRLMGVAAGRAFIRQGGSGTDLYLILSGTVGISVHGTDIARRLAGEHIGEMTTLDAGSRRSATATAIADVVVARLKSADFEAIARRFPIIWRRLATVLGARLRERAKYVRYRNEAPTVFIASSRESLPIARALKRFLPATEVISLLWTEGVFGASSFPIEDLEREIQRADFGVVVLGYDDLVTSRRVRSRAPRDNCVFELGLIMGSCGRRRGIILTPEGLPTKIPSDLLGLTPLRYSLDESTPIKRRVKTAGEAVIASIRLLGPR